MARIAALLCVPGPVPPGLGWWMAHHLAVGFSALLVCEDFQGETAEEARQFLAQSSSLHDIRTIRYCSDTTASAGEHPDQAAAIKRIIAESGTDFSWILPLAADEYFLPEQDSVQEFLAAWEKETGAEQFAATTILPVNWCLCSTDDPTLQPCSSTRTKSLFHTNSPRAIYTCHAKEDFADHRVTRSFFRPEAFETSLNGTLPSPFIAQEKPVDWHLGRILHDASASSVEQAAKTYYHRPDTAFPESKRFLHASQNIAANLFQTQLLALLYQARSQVPLVDNKFPARSLGRAWLTHDDALLVIDHVSQNLTWRPREFLDPTRETCLCLAYDASSTTDDTAIKQGWLYPEQPLPWPFLSICPPEFLHIADLLDFIAVTINDMPPDQEQKAVQVALSYAKAIQPCRSEAGQPDSDNGSTDRTISFLNLPSVTLQPIPDTYSATPPFLALSYLTRHKDSLPQILDSLPHLPWMSGAAFAAVCTQHLDTIKAPQSLFSALQKAVMTKPDCYSSPFSSSMESSFVFRPA